MTVMYSPIMRYRISIVVALFAVVAPGIVGPAYAQGPSQAQRNAIKTQCRSDYIAHCSSIPPGGEASLQCLQKNMSSLSASCAGAVRAVETPAATPKAAAPTPATTPKTEAAPPASKPAAVATTTAPAAATAAPAAIVLRPMRPREELLVMRSACGGDVRSLCGSISPGGGRIVKCLASNSASLSPACTTVLAPFAQR